MLPRFQLCPSLHFASDHSLYELSRFARKSLTRRENDKRNLPKTRRGSCFALILLSANRRRIVMSRGPSLFSFHPNPFAPSVSFVSFCLSSARFTAGKPDKALVPQQFVRGRNTTRNSTIDEYPIHAICMPVRTSVNRKDEGESLDVDETRNFNMQPSYQDLN